MTEPDGLVRSYLRDLAVALEGVPDSREILDGIEEHIRTRRAELGGGTEAEVRTVLDRLGDPRDIAARAREEAVPAAAPPAPAPGAAAWGVREVAGVLLLTVGALVLPVLAPLVGLVLVAASARWTTGRKVAALGVPVGVLLGMEVATYAVNGYWDPSITFLGLFLVPFGAGVALAVPARHRPATRADKLLLLAGYLALALLVSALGGYAYGFYGTVVLVPLVAAGAAHLGVGAGREPARAA